MKIMIRSGRNTPRSLRRGIYLAELKMQNRTRRLRVDVLYVKNRWISITTIRKKRNESP